MNYRGFTLIELLVVVAIIAILAVIAIPQFNKYRIEAAKKVCLHDVKNAVIMCAAALADNVSKEECIKPTDYPSETANAENIVITINHSGASSYIIEANAKCKGIARDFQVFCQDKDGLLSCEIRKI